MKPVVLSIDLDLGPDSLKEIASHYETLARVCRSRATEIELREATSRAARRYVQSLANTPAILDTYLSTGMSFETATEAAEAATGIPAETFAHYWRKRRTDRAGQQMTDRAIEVAKLTRQGKTDTEIAEILGIHPKSVSRIRSRHSGQSQD